MDVDKLPQTVIAIDDATIEVIHVRGRVATAFKRDHGAKRRRDDRDAREEKPLGAYPSGKHAGDEREALRELFALGGPGLAVAGEQSRLERPQVESAEDV